MESIIRDSVITHFKINNLFRNKQFDFIIGCRVVLRVLSGIAVGRLHSKSPRALGRDRFSHRIFSRYM